MVLQEIDARGVSLFWFGEFFISNEIWFCREFLAGRSKVSFLNFSLVEHINNLGLSYAGQNDCFIVIFFLNYDFIDQESHILILPLSSLKSTCW